MFSNLLFLIIVLLTATMAPMQGASPYEMGLGLLVYFTLLLATALFCRLVRQRLDPARIAFAINIGVLAGITLSTFCFGTNQLPTFLPFVGTTMILQAVWALCLYVGGVVCVCTIARRGEQSAHRLVKRPPAADFALLQLRLTAPFAIPFLLFTVLGDVSNAIVVPTSDPLTDGIIFVASAVFVLATIALFPLVLKWAWQCRPLEPGPLRERLQTICEIAEFNVRDLLTWPIVGPMVTAAIVGIIPRYRYVMFTPALLEKLSPESVEAVLVHEIGHTLRRHLLIYPFIFAGVMLPLALLSDYILPAVAEGHASWIAFAAYVAVIVLYVRFFFGYFSRLFERQADLTCFDLQQPPEQMIEALNEVGYLSGNIHDHPSWHHYSIRQRMNFLERAIVQPGLVEQHHKKVRWTVALYFIFLVCATILLVAS